MNGLNGGKNCDNSDFWLRILTLTCLSFQGITTYDYILAMKEENQAMELESLEDSDFYSSDDESIDLDSPQKPTLVSRIICSDGKSPQVVHIYLNCNHPYYPLTVMSITVIKLKSF